MQSCAEGVSLVLCCCSADSKLLLTACDDMHTNLYDVHHGALIDAFSGEETGSGDDI
jgi:hypothetical protein